MDLYMHILRYNKSTVKFDHNFHNGVLSITLHKQCLKNQRLVQYAVQSGPLLWDPPRQR